MIACKDCPDRYPGCHDKCEKYQAYAEEREKARAKRQQLNNAHYMDKELKLKIRKRKGK